MAIASFVHIFQANESRMRWYDKNGSQKIFYSSGTILKNTATIKRKNTQVVSRKNYTSFCEFVELLLKYTKEA